MDRAAEMGHVGFREQIVEYFKELYYVPPAAEILPGVGRCAVVAPNPLIRENPPACQRIERMVSELKGVRDAGVCVVPLDLLKGRWR